MEFIPANSVKTFLNNGVASEQLLFPENSESGRVTITRVTVPPGAEQPRHSHGSSEQIWAAVKGSGTLLLADGQTKAFAAGDVVRFADGDTHGLKNESAADFQYMSVTSPPINFRKAYREEK
ncbi:MAG: cupin domain-containing protein [Oscillospiraceae bacterium]|jgi:quercetin dioxygenase-like cupin family protein|nr:cupin domain-containing protein [Oscillospiraceae bacterium]